MKKIINLLVIILTLTIIKSSLADDIEVVEKEFTEKNENLSYTIDAKYPALKGMSDGEVQEKINTVVSTYIMKNVDEFKKEMVDWDTIRPADLDFTSSFEYTYNVENLTNNIYSLSFNNFSYYAGAAHPNTYISTMNFNLETGDVITFEMLFRPDSDYLQHISDYCIFDLKRHGREVDYGFDEEWLQRGAGPEIKNFEVFNITKTGLLITFNNYQVGPYAIGQQTVLIPYKEILNIVNLEGVLKPFLN